MFKRCDQVLAAAGLVVAAACAAPLTPRESATSTAPAPVREPDPPYISLNIARELHTGSPSVDPRPVASARLAYAPAAFQQARSRPRGGLAEQVRTTRLARLVLDGQESVRDMMRFFSASTGIDILVEQAAEDAAIGAALEFNVKREQSITLQDALNLIVELSDDELAWTVRDGVVVVTTPDRARRAPRTTVYDVSDLIRGISNYPGPEMNIAPSGGITPPDEDLGEPMAVINEDMLISLIMNNINPESWDRPGNSVTIRDGKLIVSHD
ncbi:MAG: hypothetical protein GY711_34800 [bacterium]|nr:hypothetical protein [bacterium]